MELDRTKCFKQGGYDLANSKVIVQFSDLSVYEYHAHETQKVFTIRCC